MSDGFEKKGFLSPSVYTHRDSVREKYGPAFSECESHSEIAQALLLNVEISADNLPLLCAYLFLERTIRSSQAAVRLCEIGLIQEAQILVRTAYETVFHASALIVKPDVFDRLQLHNDNEEAKYASAMIRDVTADEISEVNRDFLRERSSATKLPTYSAFDAAQTAGMASLYSVAYRGLSAWAGHATIRSLDRSFVAKDEEHELIMGPSEAQLVFTLSLIAQCLTISATRLAEIMGK